MVAYSLVYLFIFAKLEEKTPFISVKLFRFFSKIYTPIILATSPLFIFFFAPQTDFWEMFNMFFVLVYSVAGLLILFMAIIDIFYYGFMGFLYFLGIDIKNPEFEKIAVKYLPKGVLYGKKGT
jgi:hypothetical protein